jgi:hypothetical protein
LNENLLKRRTEMLMLSGKGVILGEVVKDLATKYDVSRTALYIDWAKRNKWIPTILELNDPEKVFYDIMVAHKEIYRMGVREYLTADNSNARIGALRLLRDLNRDFYEMSVTPHIMKRLEELEEEAAKHK